ncbi:MAG: hypothetical protein LBS74_02155 [Oscillospiraceae bacterium]|jgi:hypothetical protein|nr:hypothetical protein [Oscillospiraceae bacterium]
MTRLFAKYPLITKLILVLSAWSLAAVSLHLSLNGEHKAFYYALGAVDLLLALAVLIYLVFKKDLLDKIIKGINLKLGLFALICACFAAQQLAESSLWGFSATMRLPVALLLVPACFAWIYLFWQHAGTFLLKIYKSFSKFERLFFFIASALICVGIFVLFSMTNIFFSTVTPQGTEVSYDVIFTSDTSMVFFQKAFVNINSPQNYCDQPLFAVFSAPFAIPAELLSKLFYIIPNSNAILLQMMQAVLLVFTLILHSKMLGSSRFLFLAIASYPFLLWVFPVEQLIFSLFWLTLLIYAYTQKHEHCDLFYTSAVGSIVTTGVLLPLLHKKHLVKDILKAAFTFFSITVLFGQLGNVLDIYTYKAMMRFSGGGLSLYEKLGQFLSFVASCFVKPPTKFGSNIEGFPAILLENASLEYIIGSGLILLLCALSFVVNKKSPYTKICIGWALFSLILLGFLGWGAAENGMVLYSLYFGWCFIALIANLSKKIPKLPGMILLCLITGAMAFVNLRALAELVLFGVKNYHY